MFVYFMGISDFCPNPHFGFCMFRFAMSKRKTFFPASIKIQTKYLTEIIFEHLQTMLKSALLSIRFPSQVHFYIFLYELWNITVLDVPSEFVLSSATLDSRKRIFNNRPSLTMLPITIRFVGITKNYDFFNRTDMINLWNRSRFGHPVRGLVTKRTLRHQ